jgi:di/tripeptidase
VRPEGGGQHSEKEWISIKGLEKFYSILKEFVIKLSKEN